MLSKPSVQAANNLARELAVKGIRLMPKRGTLMDELETASNNITYKPVDYSQNDIVNFVSNDDRISNHGTASFGTSHDSIMDDYIEDIAKLASSHVLFNKSVVNSLVGGFKDEMVATFNGFKLGAPEDVFSVSYYKPHEIFGSDVLLAEIENGGGYGSGALSPSDAMPISKVNSTSYPVSTYLLTGDAEFDALIVSWIASVGEANVSSHIYSVTTPYAINESATLDYYLANYLFYRNLAERTDINMGLTQVQLRAKASTIRNSYATTLITAITDYARRINVGVFFLPYSDMRFRIPDNDEKLTLCIYTESFDKYIEGGGSLEAVFGCVASDGDTSKPVTKLLAEQERYLNAWNSVRTMYTIRANSGRLDNFKRAILMAYDKLNATLADGEADARVTTFNYQATVDKAISKYFDSLSIDAIDDLDKVAIDMIAGIRFHYTAAFSFLTDMNNILKMSEKITVEEAAFYAALNYITEYIMGQTYVIR